MGKYLSVILIVLIYLVPVSLQAEEISDEGGEQPEITSKVSSNPPPLNSNLNSLYFSGLLLPPKINILLEMRQDLLSQGDQQGSNAILLIIQILKEREGIQNLKHLSQILLWEATEAFQKGDPLQGNALIVAALKISPDFPPVYTYISRKGWSVQPWNIFENISNSLKALKMNFNDFWYFLSFIRVLLAALLISFLLFNTIFILLILLRSFPSLVHTSWEWSGKKISVFNQWGLVLLLFLFPLFWDLPFFWILLFWMSIAWFFSSRAEKTVMVSGGVILLIFLYTGPIWGVFYTAEEDHTLQVMADSVKGEWISKERIMEDSLEQAPWHMQFTAATIKKREGACDEAVSMYQQLLRKTPRKEKPLILNNLGNCFFYQRQFENAIRTYQSSIQEFPSFVAPYYNLSQTYREKLDFDKGEKIYQKALEQNEEKVSHFSFLSTLGNQYQVIDQTFGLDEIWKQVLVQREGGISKKVWRILVGEHPQIQVIYILLGWFSLLMFWVYKGPQMRITKNCQFCSKTICKKCQRHLMDHTACLTCWSELKGKPVTFFAKNHKKGVSEGIGIPLILGGLLLPGSTPILIHKSIKGAIWLILFLFFLAFFLLKQTGIFMVSDGINLIQGTGSLIPWVLFFGIGAMSLVLDLKRDLKI
jgi:tetratricopeptide (TPR) repeat protein